MPKMKNKKRKSVARPHLNWNEFILVWNEFHKTGVSFDAAVAHFRCSRSALSQRLTVLASANIYLPRLAGQHHGPTKRIWRMRAERFNPAPAPKMLGDMSSAGTLFRLVPVS